MRKDWWSGFGYSLMFNWKRQHFPKHIGNHFQYKTPVWFITLQVPLMKRNRMSLPLWPNHFLTQLLTNHGRFRSYLHKMKKAPTPLCTCPEKTEQTAWHLTIECSLHSKEQPTVLQNLLIPLIMQYHINTVDVSRFLKTIFHMLQDQSKRDQIP